MGQVKYGVSNTLEFAVDSTKLVNDVLSESAKKMNDLEYLLVFNSQEAVFEPIDYLEIDNSDFSRKMALKLAGTGTYYINLRTEEKLISKNFLGDQFLIQYPFIKADWIITKETKVIEGYKCIKATLNIEPNAIRTKGTVISAWFSPELPVGIGPKNYSGVPGLILELNEGKLIYYAKEISLESETDLRKPNKGLKITEQDYNQYILDKSKELGFSKE